MPPESSQEKTEQPTPKRLREARKKGQVFKSRDLEAVVVLMAIFGALGLSYSFMVTELHKLMEACFGLVGRPEIYMEDVYALGQMAFMSVVKLSAPILVAGTVLAAIAGFLQVGPVFSVEPLKPEMKKLNAIENLKNMMKPKTLVELLKNIVKIFAVFILAYTVLKGMLEPFLLTVTTSLEGSSKLGGMILMKFMIRFLILFLVIALIDLFLQRREYMKNLKMTKEEVKREYKEDEGDPLIKGHRRQLHMEMAMGDVRQKVKNADAVVTNPTHLAIALQYDKKNMVAPQVVAKGQRLFAEYIRELAKEYDIPIVRNVPLAWSLIELEIEDEIPEPLYVAVAEILSFVYRLKQDRNASK